MPEVPVLVLFGHAAGALLFSWIFFYRYQIVRPPVGVINLWDVTLLMGAIILVPMLYLTLPHWFVTALLALGAAGALFVIAEPILPTRLGQWLAVLVVLAVNVGVQAWLGATTTLSFLINNVVLILIVVGITNLWAQSGLRARDAAVLAGFLTIYDGVATSWLPTTTTLMERLAELPFAPVVGWPIAGDGSWLALGLGDLLLAATFPLVLLKSYGRIAGLAALVLTLAAIGIALTLVVSGMVQSTLPVMVILGPLMIMTYLVCVRFGGSERTMWQYRQDNALQHQVTSERT